MFFVHTGANTPAPPLPACGVAGLRRQSHFQQGISSRGMGRATPDSTTPEHHPIGRVSSFAQTPKQHNNLVFRLTRHLPISFSPESRLLLIIESSAPHARCRSVALDRVAMSSPSDVPSRGGRPIPSQRSAITNPLSLPSQWLHMYDEFITKNAHQVSQIESTLRSLTYIIPGTYATQTLSSTRPPS